MVPGNCCLECDGLNDDGKFRNKLRCMLTCDKIVNELSKKLYDEQKEDKGCSTCKNCKHVIDYPGYVTGEESICTVGLECDTVLFKVKQCPKWIGEYD